VTRYLIDTSTLVDYSKNREPALSRIHLMIADGHELCTCAVVVAEFYAGLPPTQQPVWDAFLGSFTYLDMPWTVGKRAGIDLFAFARRGQPLEATDALIAATARHEGAVLVTDNARHFPMPDLQAISLRP
jgi:predicted nucleic acid-binding protein